MDNYKYYADIIANGLFPQDQYLSDPPTRHTNDSGTSNHARDWIIHKRTEVPVCLRYPGFQKLIDFDGRNLAMNWVIYTRFTIPDYLQYPNF